MWNNLAEEKIILFSEDILSEYVIVDEKEKTPEELALYFLNSCDIKCTNINDLDGHIIPRETLLDLAIYDKIKADIPKIKHLLSSTKFTAVQKNADLSQKWPLINLIRQILRKYNYLLIPKRVCDGYTKDGVKKYKRFFEIKRASSTLSSFSEEDLS